MFIPVYAVYHKVRGDWYPGRPPEGIRAECISSVAGMTPGELKQVKSLPEQAHEAAIKAAKEGPHGR